MSLVNKNLKLFYSFARAHFKLLIAYKIDALLQTVHWVSVIGVWTIFWNLIFSYTQVFVRWTFPDTVVLTGMSYLGWGFFMFSWGFRSIPEMVNRGHLDRYLCRPVYPLLGVIFEGFFWGLLVEIAIGGVIVLSTFLYFGIPFKLLNLVLGLFTQILGVVILSCIYGVISCLSFWYGRSTAAYDFIDYTSEFYKYPITAFNLSIQQFLTFGVPIIFVATYPTLILLDKVNFMDIFYILSVESLLCSFWLLLFLRLWRMGLRRYQSYGG